MFNKHFIKTLLLFSLIILLGLAGVLVANSFEGGDNTEARAGAVKSSVFCGVSGCD